MRINLGCGATKEKGYDCWIDKVDFGFNEVCDIEISELSHRCNSVDFIMCHHVLEHLKDCKNILNECHRILKANGIMEIRVPYGLWPGASKPVHYQNITACWFDWLRRDDLYERYGYKNWNIILLDEYKNKRGEIYEVHCIMSPKNKDYESNSIYNNERPIR